MTARAWLGNAGSAPIVRNAAVTALIVGPILTAINQGDAVLAGRGLDWLKVALTFAVPYTVATVAGANARTAARRGVTGQGTGAHAAARCPDPARVCAEIDAAAAAVRRIRQPDGGGEGARADAQNRLAHKRAERDGNAGDT